MSTVAKEVQVIKATKTGEKAEKIRVAAYCRVSTDKDDQLNLFFAQISLRFLQAHGLSSCACSHVSSVSFHHAFQAPFP